MLRKILPETILDKGLSNSVQRPKCPGMKYKHYAPRADVEVVMGDKENIRKYISKKLKENSNAGVMTYCGGDYEDAVCVMSAGYTMEQYASKLFYNLRVFDEYKVDKIYAEFFDEDGMGTAVRNRLYKSAGNHITEV